MQGASFSRGRVARDCGRAVHTRAILQCLPMQYHYRDEHVIHHTYRSLQARRPASTIRVAGERDDDDDDDDDTKCHKLQ